MAKRICWKKGMRLSDAIMKTSDDKHAELVGNAFMLATAGRFGLFPASRPFELSINITGSGLDVEALRCLAITKGGQLIDIDFDTKYTCPFDSYIAIPAEADEKELFLTVSVLQDQWKETSEGYEEPVCAFSLISPHTPIPSNAMPIGRIVNDYGWRMDDADFTPPCLFVSSHPKYEDLLRQFLELLAAVDTKARKLLNSNGKDAIRLFWPITQQLWIAIDKERDVLTPMTLLADVQKFVSAFTCACELDENLNLADVESFTNYIHAPYNYENAYQRIKEGLELCFSISEKMDKLSQSPAPQPATPQKIAVPVVKQLQHDCKTKETIVPISYDNASASIFFTIDGSEPTDHSMKAQKTKGGFIAKFDNGYRQENGDEPDKVMTLKVIAVVGGISSEKGVFQLSLHKSRSFWNGKII